MTYTKDELVAWYEELNQELLACDPSVSAEALDSFHEIQEESDVLARRVAEAGLTMEDIEDLSLS